MGNENDAAAIPAGVTLPRLLSASQVMDVLGVSRTTLYRITRDEAFSEAVRIGGRAVRWRADEIAEWIGRRDRVACDAAAV